MLKLTVNKGLILIQAVVGFSAIAGGLSLINQPEMMPLDWLEGTFFENYFLPGVILFGVVGLSAIVSFLSLIFKLSGRLMANLLASTILLFWLSAEIVIIDEINPLQLIYYALGFTGVFLTYRLSKQE